jgi:hypothetical protein
MIGSEVVTYELPDGTALYMHDAESQCVEVPVEVLFVPILNGSGKEDSNQDIIVNAIKLSQIDLQKGPVEVVLSGGNTMIKGFPERLGKEVDGVIGDHIVVNIVAPSDCKYSA